MIQTLMTCDTFSGLAGPVWAFALSCGLILLLNVYKYKTQYSRKGYGSQVLKFDKISTCIFWNTCYNVFRRKENNMSVDPVLPHDLDDLYGPGAEEADATAESEWKRKHYEKKDLSIYEVYYELEDFLVSSCDDGDGYMQDAPEEIKAKQRQEIADIEQALKLIFPFMVEYAQIHGLRVR